MDAARKQATVYLEYQPYIAKSPATPKQLFQQACSNDEITVDSWKDTWVNQVTANRAIKGPFKDNSIGQLFGAHRHQPIFVVGAGPSLKKNAHLLKENHQIPIISCLHNFHFLEDLGVNVTYYVTLDAGEITIPELSEGGNPETDYWAKTKDKTLLAYIGTHPNLLAKWQGKVLFYNCGIPSPAVEEKIDAVERFKVLVSTGGNVLGACLYIAKAYLGCSTTIFLGADFSFSYEEKFHPFDTKYDHKLGNCVRLHDVYGVPVKSWMSYVNFKSFFDYVCQVVPGEYINATEGGILGAYADGNIQAIQQMDLKDVLKRFCMSELVREQVENPETSNLTLIY